VITVGVPSGPLAGAYDVAAQGKTVWVYNWGDQTIRAADGTTNRVERIVPIGGFPPTTGSSVAADPGGAWVLSREGGSGLLTRVRPGLEYARKTKLGYDPRAVAVGAGAVWVAAKNATQEVVLRIAPRTGAVLTRRFLKGADIQSIAVGQGPSGSSRAARSRVSTQYRSGSPRESPFQASQSGRSPPATVPSGPQ
jgi:hypothetical protein